MKLGYFSVMQNPGHQLPYRRLLTDLVEETLAVEEAGYHAVWLGEHHFGGEGYDIIPNPITIAAYLAAETSRIRLGLAAVIVPHGSYRRAGAIIGAALGAIEIPRRCIILGASHTGTWMPWSLMGSGWYRTPLGDVPIDEALAEALRVPSGKSWCPVSASVVIGGWSLHGWPAHGRIRPPAPCRQSGGPVRQSENRSAGRGR